MSQRRSQAKTIIGGLGQRQEIAPRVFVNTQYHTCNTGFVVTRECVVLIDTPLVPQQARDWRQQIAEESRNMDIGYILLTDHHRGHALGCQYFMPAQVIGHERVHKEMQGYTDNFRDRVRNSFRREPEIQQQLQVIDIILPHITFTERAGFILGDTKIECIYVGGHTPATSIIWLEKERICFVGDTIWTDQHPYMAQANSREWLEALKLIAKLDPVLIVPGHGNLCTVDDINHLSDYIHLMREGVARCLRDNKDKLETKRILVEEMVHRFDIPSTRKSKIESQIGSGINRVYRELQREMQAKASPRS